MSSLTKKLYPFLKVVKSKILNILEYGTYRYSSDKDNNRLSSLEIIDSLNLSKLEELSRSKYQLLEIPVIYHNINIYIQELKEIAILLKNKKEIVNKYKLNAEYSIYMIDFYIDDNIMQDRIYVTNKFLKLSKIVIEYYKTYVGENNVDYSIAYNVRILKYIVENLEKIIFCLDKYCRGE